MEAGGAGRDPRDGRHDIEGNVTNLFDFSDIEGSPELNTNELIRATSSDAFEPRKRVGRRKHRNSKLGCLECKKRRIKCDETLPECRNCRNRVQKPGDVAHQCSYLRMSEEQIKEFKTLKKQNCSAHLSRAARNSSYQLEQSEPLAEDLAVEIVMIPHRRVDIPESAWICMVGMENMRVPRALYLQLLLNCTQDWSLSTKGFVVLAIYASIKSLTRKIEIAQKRKRLAAARDLLIERASMENIAVRYHGQLLSFVRHIISTFLTSELSQGDKLVGTRLLISNSNIQYTLMYKNSGYDDKHHIAMIDMCIEMSRKNKIEKLTRALHYYWVSLPLHLTLLYYPAYSTDLLYEVVDVLRKLKPFISSVSDRRLELHYKELTGYLNYLVSLLPLASGVMPLPIDTMYEVYRRWTLNVPGEAFCILDSMSGVHRVFYTFYHSIPAYLNNLFPAGCYLMSRPFYGPTSFYPFSLKTIFYDLEPRLGPFAEFSIRLVSFMERRSYMLRNFFTVVNPFPMKVSEQRFHNRKVCNMTEKFISSLRNQIIGWENYPDIFPIDERDNNLFHAAVREPALSQIESWRAAKAQSGPEAGVFDAYTMEPKDMPGSILLGEILKDMKCDEDYSMDRRKTLLLTPAVKYSSGVGHAITERGMFDKDCDITLFFEPKPPALLATSPTIEDIERYKLDRLCLIRDSDKNLIY
ncbi:LAME_0A05314g1_1 [Lachancea meyersii CBS 8951]|uniref:LAME_0A05314g1_1 n=1 Tax=Lachancea meyersii CBS 8951 TaxID=1266667 RepID=A0A1G4IPT3_9SACH|nr:LAME_0A05314g1_1 [Lachancea meyersii CBS 8951]